MLVVGVAVQITLQALLHMAVNTNSIPATGISLPFFSYGGTALILQLVEVGLVLSVSRQADLDMRQSQQELLQQQEAGGP
ncbi:MAG: FtsW/RodA/SpoVE family cell cycle protein, partial [Oscillospiraceae bacterium]